MAILTGVWGALPGQVTYGLATQYHVFQFYAPTFLLFESTTLFINVRWLLVELNLKDSKLYLFNGLALLIAVTSPPETHFPNLALCSLNPNPTTASRS
jgi:hypothetical protein